MCETFCILLFLAILLLPSLVVDNHTHTIYNSEFVMGVCVGDGGGIYDRGGNRK